MLEGTSGPPLAIIFIWSKTSLDWIPGTVVVARSRSFWDWGWVRCQHRSCGGLYIRTICWSRDGGPPPDVGQLEAHRMHWFTVYELDWRIPCTYSGTSPHTLWLMIGDRSGKERWARREYLCNLNSAREINIIILGKLYFRYMCLKYLKHLSMCLNFSFKQKE